MLRSNLCDFSAEYIVVKETTTLAKRLKEVLLM